MKTIIAGSRTINDYAFVEKVIGECGWKITEVVSGCAGGVDELGERWATRREIPIARFPADWKQFGKRAGPVRNGAMAVYADALIAIWDGESKGTKDMISQAEKHKLEISMRQYRRTTAADTCFTDTLCSICGVGFLLPSGRCDHCNCIPWR